MSTAFSRRILYSGRQGLPGPPGYAVPLAANSLFGNLTNASAVPGPVSQSAAKAFLGYRTEAEVDSAIDNALDEWIVTWDSIEAGALPVSRLPSVVGRKDQSNAWAETQLFQKPITVQDGGGNNVFDVVTNQIRFRSASAGYLLGPSGQIVAGEDAGGYYFGTGLTTPTKPIYIGQSLTSQLIPNAELISNRTNAFHIRGIDGTGWAPLVAGSTTINGDASISGVSIFANTGYDLRIDGTSAGPRLQSYLSKSLHLNPLGNPITFPVNTWHGSLNGAGTELQRFYYGDGSTTYLQGHGSTPFIFRNGAGNDLISVASSGASDFVGRMKLTNGSIHAGHGATYPASTYATYGTSIGFDGNLEHGWIQAVRFNVGEIRSLQIQPLGGNVMIGTTTNQAAKFHVEGTSSFSSSASFNAGVQFKTGTWLTSNEPLSRIYFDENLATYFMGYGSTPFIFRNGDGTNLFGAQATGDFSIGTSSPGNSYTRLLVYKDGNARNAVTVRNESTGSSATSEMILNAYGNSWGLKIGSAANNSNAFEIREDALGANTLRFTMATGGAAGAGAAMVGSFRTTGPDAAYLLALSGTSYGIRMGSTAGYGAFIQGVDPTLSGSYEPLNLGGSLVRVESPFHVVGAATFNRGLTLGADAAGAERLTFQGATATYRTVIENNYDSNRSFAITTGGYDVLTSTGEAYTQVTLAGTGTITTVINGQTVAMPGNAVATRFVTSTRNAGVYEDGTIKWGQDQTGNRKGLLTWDTDKAIISAPLLMDITCGSTLTITSPTQTIFSGLRPITVEAASGLLTCYGDAGGYLMGLRGRGSANTFGGDFGFVGSADVISYQYIGWQPDPTATFYPDKRTVFGASFGYGNARFEQPSTASAALKTYETSLSAWQEPWRGQASASGATIGFLGATPLVRQTLPAAATDAATTQTLANALRTALIDFGLAN